MSRDQRQLMFCTGEAGLQERVLALIELALFSDSRASRRHYSRVTHLLNLAFAQTDEKYTVRFGTDKSGKNLYFVACLFVLAGALYFEWQAITGPAVREWASAFLQKCGGN